MRGLLTATRCDEIKEEIIFMFEECEIHTWPIDCFLIAERLYFVLRPYSSLPPRQRLEALLYDEDGFSRVEENSDTGMLQYVIYYNDTKGNDGRMRWTVFHEIGHIRLGHHDNKDSSMRELEEAEADFFAKYSIAPPPLISIAKCKDMFDIQNTFQTSAEASAYIYDYYMKWIQFGPREYEPFELRLIALFQAA